MRLVLVVDDDVTYGQLCAVALRHEKYVVSCADSVAGAKSTLEHSAPIAMLLDWRLPDGTGLDVLQWMQDRRLRIPTALVSGFWSDDEFVRAASDAMRLGATRAVRRGIDDDSPTEIVGCLVDPLFSDHLGVRRSDPAATERLAAQLLDRLRPRLRSAFRRATDDQIVDAITDATIEHLSDPGRFEPAYDLSLEAFIYVAARRNLANLFRSEQRHQRRDYAFARQTTLTTDPDDLTDVRPLRLIEAAVNMEEDSEVRRALRHWLHGDKTVDCWSRVSSLPTESVRSKKQAIKRVKDAFIARLKRFARQR